MGIFPNPSPSDLAPLIKLLTSPGVKYGADQLKRSIPFIGGPLLGSRLPSSSSSRVGASPVIGSWHEGVSSGDVFGNAVGSVLSRLNPNAKPDPLMSLYEQLINQLQQPVASPQGINTDDLMSQVHNALDPLYNRRADIAESQSGRNRKEVERMYRLLSEDYERLAPQQLDQEAAAQREIEGLYGQLRSNIEGSYSRVAKEQTDLFNQLGIQDAASDVLSDQQPAVTDALTAASENQAQQAQRYMDMGQADATYYREGSPNATMTGNEVQTGMLQDLQDYLQQLEAERASSIQSTYMDQLNQAQNRLLQQQQMASSEAGRRQGMLWDILQTQLQGNSKAAQISPLDSFMSQLPPQMQQQVASAFTQLQRSPEAVYGKVEDKRNPVPGTFVETTPQWFMAQADEMLKRGQIDAVTHQALLMYLQLYYGNK